MIAYCLVLLCAVLCSLPALSMGMRGSYVLKGIVYDKGKPLQRTMLLIRLGKKEWTVRTDSRAVFTIEVTWETACYTTGSVENVVDLEKLSTSMNPPLRVRYHKRWMKVTNAWLETVDCMHHGIKKPTIRRNIFSHRHIRV